MLDIKALRGADKGQRNLTAAKIVGYFIVTPKNLARRSDMPGVTARLPLTSSLIR